MSDSPERAVRPRGRRLLRMIGRDPDDAHRAATPLELLFDLAFVVSYETVGHRHQAAALARALG